MTPALWAAVAAAAALAMTVASRAALRHAVALVDALRLPPFIVGVTLPSVGTDLPEIVNSVVSSYLAATRTSRRSGSALASVARERLPGGARA